MVKSTRKVGRMTTLAKIESNRRNAQRSTGPRTGAGKAISSKNSLRHGLLSKQITLPDEDREAFTSFIREMTAKLAPEGPLEELLAERVTANAWRLRRVYRLESGLLTYRMLDARTEQARTEARHPEIELPRIAGRTNPNEYDKAVKTAEHAEAQPDTDPVAVGLIRDAAGADALSKLARYETNLERGLYRALHELQRLQAARAGQPVAPPVAVDVEVSAGGQWSTPILRNEPTARVRS